MDPTPRPQHNGRLSPTRSSVGPDLHIDLHIDQHIDFAAFAFPIETIYRAFVFVGCDIICSAYISIETWDYFFCFVLIKSSTAERRSRGGGRRCSNWIRFRCR